jgi:putative phosphoesterase
MRLALLGDIHGNAAALSAVLQAVRGAGIDTLCLTGDFVGYYYAPDEVLALLHGWQAYSIRGNHEDLLLEAMHDEAAAIRYRQRYGSGVDRAAQVLSSAQMNWITQLPRTLSLEFGGKSLLLAHGAPWDTDHYMYVDVEPALWDKVADTGADYVVLGHTHHRFAKRVRQALVINPGSVGQPRDRRPGAAWAILDTDSGEVDFRTESYDIEALAGQARATDPHLPYLWQVLTRT